VLLAVLIAVGAACGPAASAAHRSGKVSISYDGQVDLTGSAPGPGHATFSASGTVSDHGSVLIVGHDTGPIVYTTLTFTATKGTFVVAEKIVKGGEHTWTLDNGTGAYRGLHGTGVESGRPDSSGHVSVVMTGSVTE
jgi:hypothetical protein